ncbi:MAG TPA: hypothetical protein VHY77_11105, partial [Acidimicrobiales bacterium]|nr:hypothetical protein [Acidimicrobiales bacterium]
MSIALDVKVDEAGVDFDPFELQDTVTGDIRDPYPLIAQLRRQGAVHVGAIDFTLSDPVAAAAAVDTSQPAPVSVFGHDEVVIALRDAKT